MKSGTMFIREQGIKGIAYRFFSLNDGTQFSMGVDAISYPEEYWNSYHDAVECFINSLTDSLKEQFWLDHKEDSGFVNWSNAVELGLKANVTTGFDNQLINDFVDDFNLMLLTCD